MDSAEQIAVEVDLAWQQHDQITYQSTRALRRSQLIHLAEQQDWRCCHCGAQMDGKGHDLHAPTMERVVPHSKGGIDAPGNLVAACRRCNGERNSTRSLEHRRTPASAGSLKHPG